MVTLLYALRRYLLYKSILNKELELVTVLYRMLGNYFPRLLRDKCLHQCAAISLSCLYLDDWIVPVSILL